jgi:hypothetical protein
MSYQPPHKRKGAKSLKGDPVKDSVKGSNSLDYPELTKSIDSKEPKESKSTDLKMNFAALFKRAIQKKKIKKLKWGTILLTKKGRIDSMTAEERLEEENQRDKEIQEQRMLSLCCRLEKQQNIRREFDPYYESPEEWSESESEQEEEEEEEVLTDDFEEDEFEPDI